MSQNFDVYIPVVLLMGFAIIIIMGALIVGRFIRPHHPTELKQTAYECGELPVGSAWSFFNVRFYVVGLIFIIFDVESALMFPVVTVFKELNSIGKGGIVLVEILIFLAVLVSGVAYCWRKGDLDWVKSFQNTVGNKIKK